MTNDVPSRIHYGSFRARSSTDRAPDYESVGWAFESPRARFENLVLFHMTETNSDIGFMREAIEEARIAGAMGEVPVGCVVSRGGSIIARAHNLRENRSDPTAHAEILALRAAGMILGSRRLVGTTLYVTLEPCPMCMAAIMLAGVKRIVFGAEDREFGAVSSHWNMPHDPAFKHDILVTAGIEGAECSALMADFFEPRRS